MTDTAKLKDAFLQLDRDGSGSLSAAELGPLFDLVGVSLPPAQLQKYMDQVDKNKNGTLDLDEFIQICKECEGSDARGKKMSSAVQMLIKEHGGSSHSFSEAEVISFSNYVNEKLAEDPDCNKYLPLHGLEMFEKIKDGVLLIKLINLSSPNTIDERVVNKKPRNKFQMNENHDLALGSASAIGCSVVNIGANDMMAGTEHLVLGIVWQIIRIGLVRDINLKKHPEMRDILPPEDAKKRPSAVSPEDLLLAWLNHLLVNAEVDKRVHNFTKDLQNSEAYAYVLDELASDEQRPEMHTPATILADNDPVKRADLLLENADVMDSRKFVSPTDIAEGNYKLNVAFIACLFNKYPGIHEKRDSNADKDPDVLPLIKWVNEQLKNADSKRRIKNLTSDIEDSEVYYTIVKFIADDSEKDIIDQLDGFEGGDGSKRAEIIVSSAEAIRCRGNLQSEDILGGDREKNIEFVRELMEKDTDPDVQPLIKWINGKLEEAGSDRRIKNLASNLQDCIVYAKVIWAISDATERRKTDALKNIHEEKDTTIRAELILQSAAVINCSPRMTSEEVLEGDKEKNVHFTKILMNKETDPSTCKLIRWMNEKLDKTDSDRRISNLTNDIQDSEAYAMVLSQICHEDQMNEVDCLNELTQEYEYLERAVILLKSACIVVSEPLISAQDISEGDRDQNIAFVQQLMDVETDEKLSYLLNWINDHLRESGDKRRVRNLTSDLKDFHVYSVLVDSLVVAENPQEEDLDASEQGVQPDDVIRKATNLGCNYQPSKAEIINKNRSENIKFIKSLRDAEARNKKMSGVAVESEDHLTNADSSDTDDDSLTLAIAKYINENLKDDDLCCKYLPLRRDDIYTKIRDGVLILKLINHSVPETVDERVISENPKDEAQMMENLDLALGAASSIGCSAATMSPSDIMDGNRPVVEDFLWQIIMIGLVSKINLQQHPEMKVLVSEDEDIKNLMALSPEELLVRWVNHHLKNSGTDRRISNFTSDIQDSEAYIHLLRELGNHKQKDQMHHPDSVLIEPNHATRAELTLQSADVIGCRKFVSPTDIAEGNYKLNVAFVANLFNKYPGLEAKENDGDEDTSDIVHEETREEKTFRNWINSLGLKTPDGKWTAPYLNDLSHGIADGIIIMAITDTIKPNEVDWKRVSFPPFHKRKAEILGRQNCMYAIEHVEHLPGVKLVSIGGNDIYDRRVTLVLGLVWQMMRAYTQNILDGLSGDQPESKSQADVDNYIINWTNDTLKQRGKETHIKDFKDKEIKKSLVIIDLIDAIRPDIVNYDIVEKQPTTPEQLMDNASLAINWARKAGARIYALPEDIVEGKNKMVMTIFACLMTRGLENR